jgi:hypothetical protein
MRVAIYTRVSTDDKGQDPLNQLLTAPGVRPPAGLDRCTGIHGRKPLPRTASGPEARSFPGRDSAGCITATLQRPESTAGERSWTLPLTFKATNSHVRIAIPLLKLRVAPDESHRTLHSPANAIL